MTGPEPLARLLADGDRAGARMGVLAPGGAGADGPAASYLLRLSPGSRPAMASSLRTLGRLAGEAHRGGLDVAALSYAEVHTLRARVVAAAAPATARRHLAALRGVLREAWRGGLISTEGYLRMIDFDPVPGSSLAAGRAVTPIELGALLDACRADAGPLGVRDAATIGLLAGAGLRRAEAAGLDVGDLDGTDLRVRGKGDRERLAMLAPWGARLLEAWLALRSRRPGPLLVAVDEAGLANMRRLTGHALYRRLRRRARQAGLEDLKPHDLRRGWVTSLLDAGADLAVVQRLAGHASVTTTTRYDRRGDSAGRDAVARLPTPG